MPHYIEVESSRPNEIKYIKTEPLIFPGKSGTFDETGITITSIE